MKFNNVEMKKITIECASPVHIGNGQTLKSFEYLYDKDNSEVLFINRSPWIKFLAKHSLMDNFAKYINVTAAQLAKKGQFRGIMPWQWLINKGISREELEALAIRRSFATAKVFTRTGKQSLNDISVNMALADGKPYIPGSSIKGALRTAILFKLLNNPKNRKVRLKCWNKIEKISDLGCDKADEAINFLENILFDKMEIGDDRHSMINSTMRGIRIGDATCINDDIRTVILRKAVAIAQDNDRKKVIRKLPLYLECIPSATRLEFQLTVDYKMLNLIGIRSFDDIFVASREFITYNHDVWNKVFAAEYGVQLAEMNAADLWIGSGTGFLSKTLIYALAPDDKKVVAKNMIAKYLDKVFKKNGVPEHNHVKKDTKLSPRSLKLVHEKMEHQIIGLCRLVEV